jgi:hypothetical protein
MFLGICFTKRSKMTSGLMFISNVFFEEDMDLSKFKVSESDIFDAISFV